jgi:hypothetical protein
MATVSVMACATEGFDLIRRRPWAFAGWVALWMLLGIGPILFLMAVVGPRFIDLVTSLQASAQEIDHAAALGRILAFELSLLPLFATWSIALLVVSAVSCAAIYRAVLEPGKSAFAYLRLGMDEVRLFFTQLLLVILMFAFQFLLVGGAIGLFILSHMVIGHPWEGWIDTLVVILGLCLFVWVIFRMSMALPATFAEKHIRIFESWRLTRGNFWPLVGVWALTILIIMAVAAGLGLIGQIVFLSVGLMTGAFDKLDTLATAGNDVRRMLHILVEAFGPALIALVILQAIVNAMVRVLAIAPFARVYAQLSGREAPAEIGST